MKVVKIKCLEQDDAQKKELPEEVGEESGQLIIESMIPGDYRDTVQVPVGGTVTFRIQATDFVGKFPFHCHVTAHQGIGMMQLVEVVDHEGKCVIGH